MLQDVKMVSNRLAEEGEDSGLYFHNQDSDVACLLENDKDAEKRSSFKRVRCVSLGLGLNLQTADEFKERRN